MFGIRLCGDIWGGEYNLSGGERELWKEFDDSSALSPYTFTIPEGVKSIGGKGCFAFRTKMQRLILPSSLESWAIDGAFSSEEDIERNDDKYVPLSIVLPRNTSFSLTPLLEECYKRDIVFVLPTEINYNALMNLIDNNEWNIPSSENFKLAYEGTESNFWSRIAIYICYRLFKSDME